jgi:hypothetical protein
MMVGCCGCGIEGRISTSSSTSKPLPTFLSMILKVFAVGFAGLIVIK